MFTFTTQTIINSLVEGKDYQLTVGKHPTLRIGNIRFTANNEQGTIRYWKQPATPENLPSVSFDLSTLIVDNEVQVGNYRIALYIGLWNASQDSTYANDFVNKGRPFYFEFAVKAGDTATKIAQRIIANTKKYMAFMVGENLVTLTNDNGVLKITGINGYQIFKLAALQKYNPDAIKIDCCTNDGNFEDIIVGIPRVYTLSNGVVETVAANAAKYIDADGARQSYVAGETPIEPGIPAFGDYNYMMNNLRIPTQANTDYFAVTKLEMPTVGATYDQYTFELCKDRDGIAGEVVGQRATSVTTHVFYVNHTLASAFDTLLGANKLGLTESKAEWQDGTKTVAVTQATPFAPIPEQ